MDILPPPRNPTMQQRVPKDGYVPASQIQDSQQMVNPIRQEQATIPVKWSMEKDRTLLIKQKSDLIKLLREKFEKEKPEKSIY